MAETTFDLYDFLDRETPKLVVSREDFVAQLNNLGFDVGDDQEIDDFLYKVDPEVLLEKMSRKQLETLLKTTFIGKNGGTYRFDLLKCMESNPALARFIVREFGVEGCRYFGFNVYDKINETFVSMGKKALESGDWNFIDFKKNLQNLLLLLPETELVQVVTEINDGVKKLTSKITGHTGLNLNQKELLCRILDEFKKVLFAGVSEPIRKRLNAVYQSCVMAEKDSFGAKIKESLEEKLGDDSFDGDDDNKRIKDDVDFSKALGAFSLFSAKDEEEGRKLLSSEMGKYDGAELKDKRVEEAKKKIKEDLRVVLGLGKKIREGVYQEISSSDAFISSIKRKLNYLKEEKGKNLSNEKTRIAGLLRGVASKLTAFYYAVEKEGNDGYKIEDDVIDILINAINNATKEKEKEQFNRLTYEEAETLKTFLKENGVDLDVVNKDVGELKFDPNKANNNALNVWKSIPIIDVNGLLYFNSEKKIDDIKPYAIEHLERQIHDNPFDSAIESVLEKIAITTIIEDGKPVNLLEKLVELNKEGKEGAEKLLTCLSEHVNAVGAGCFKEDDVVKILGKGDNINDATLLNLFIGNTEVRSAEISPSSRELLYNTAERLFNIFSRVAFEGEENERKLREDFAFFDEKGEQKPFTRKMVEAANTVKKDIDLLLEGLGDEEKKKKLKDISGVENIEDIKIIKLLNIIEGSEKDKKTIEEELKSFFKDNPTEPITKELNELKKSVSEAIKKRKEEEENQKTEEEKQKAEEENKKLRYENKKLRYENKKLKTDLAKKSKDLSKLQGGLSGFTEKLEKQKKKFEALQNKPRVTNEGPKTAKVQGVKTQTQETTKRQQYHDSRYYNNEVVRVIDAILTSTNIKELENNLENVREKVSPKAFVNGMLEAIRDSVNKVKEEGNQSEFHRLKDFAEIISTKYQFQNIETKQRFEKLLNSVNISLYPQREYQPAGREVKIVQQQVQQPNYGQIKIVQQQVQQPNYGQIKIVQQQAQPQGFNLDRQLSTKEYLQCLVDIYTQNVTLMLNLLNRFGVAQANLDMHNIRLNNVNNGISMYI